MTLADLDPVIHAPKRLAAMAVLTSSDHVTFRFLLATSASRSRTCRSRCLRSMPLAT